MLIQTHCKGPNQVLYVCYTYKRIVMKRSRSVLKHIEHTRSFPKMIYSSNYYDLSFISKSTQENSYRRNGSSKNGPERLLPVFLPREGWFFHSLLLLCPLIK